MVVNFISILRWSVIIFSASFSSTSSLGYGVVRDDGSCFRKAIEPYYAWVLAEPGNWRNLPPIILLHGLFDSRMTWMHIAPKMAELTGRKVYGLDMRDHGESPWTNTFNMDVLVDDLDCFMLSHRISKAVLVGHSLGAKTVMSFVLKKPHKAEKVILEDMYAKQFDVKAYDILCKATQWLKVAEDSVPEGADETRARMTMGIAAVAAFTTTNDDIQDDNAEMGLKTVPIRKVGDRYRWQANLDGLEKSLLVPGALNQHLKGSFYGSTLLIYGKKSVFNVTDDPSISKFFPNTQFVEVENATHLLHQFYPKEFLTAAVSFINAPSTHRDQYPQNVPFRCRWWHQWHN